MHDNLPIDKRALLTLPSVARLIDLSEESVRHLVKSKQLPSVKVGARRMVRREDLDAWLAKLNEAA